MVEDAIKQYDDTEPKSTTNVDDAPTVIPENWAAMEEMMGSWMQGLEITCAGSDSLTIDYTRLGMELNTGTPPLIFVDRSPSTITVDWSNGEVMNGRETGLSSAAGWKYVWVFRDDTNGVTSGLFSAATAIGSVVEPDTDFRFGRLVGAGYWDGSVFTAFKQYDREVVLESFTQVVTNGRSDAAWSSAVSLATVVPTLARFASVITETAAGANNLLQIAANSSGHYVMTLQREIGGDLHSNTSRIMLLTQNLHYWTEETGTDMDADIYITGYEINI